MQTKTASRLAWGLWGLFLALAGIGLVLIRANEGSLSDDLFSVPIVGFIAGVGALIASRRPENTIGWLLLIAGLGAVMGFISGEYARFGVLHDALPRDVAAWIGWVSEWIWLPTFGMIPTFLILLFPDGRLPSPRWRPVAWFVALTIFVGTLGPALDPGLLELEGVRLRNPSGLDGVDLGFLEAAFFPVLILAIVLCFAGFVFRFVRSRGEERQQIRWFLRAAAVSAVAFAVGDLVPELLGEVLFWGGILAIGASIAVGVLKYRLYEIDLVVKKTLVYGLLAAAITGVYLLLVVAIPATVLHPTTTGQTVITAGVTAGLTLALLPLRRRLTHLANRLVYGKRATPYEVLTDFAGRLSGSYSFEDVLPRMARVLGEATGAERAEVLIRGDDGMAPAAAWPDGALAGDGTDLAVPVTHQGEELGALSVRKPRAEPLTPGEEKLVRDLAAQAGLVLRNVRLLEDLRASRKRLVAAQDAERRRLERDIHDGAQQQLVAMAVKLRLLESLAERDAAKTRELAAQIKDEAAAAIETLRDLARGIYPPLLADEGLPAALAAQARKSPLPVDVYPDGVGRYPQEVEAAVYFCVLEALQNVAKYAEASRAEVRLSATEGELRFEVVDDGRGFDPVATPRGTGTQNMADRLEALGGRLDIRSSPGEGTTVAGRVPAGVPR